MHATTAKEEAMHLKVSIWEGREEGKGRGGKIVQLCYNIKNKNLISPTQVIYFYHNVERCILDMCPFQMGKLQEI